MTNDKPSKVNAIFKIWNRVAIQTEKTLQTAFSLSDYPKQNRDCKNKILNLISECRNLHAHDYLLNDHNMRWIEILILGVLQSALEHTVEIEKQITREY